MSAYRFTSTGQPWHVQPMPDRNRTRTNGARFESDDIRKGTIRGFLSVLLIILSALGLIIAWGF